MQHCDPDVLGLVALGERPSPSDARHLAECAECRAGVAELRGVVDAVRVDASPGPAVVPPPRVWEGIAALTGVSVAPRPDLIRAGAGLAAPPADVDVPAPSEGGAASGGPAQGGAAPGGTAPGGSAPGGSAPGGAAPGGAGLLSPDPPQEPTWEPTSERRRDRGRPEDGPGTVRRLRPARRERPWRLLAVAAAGLVVGAAGGAAVTAARTGQAQNVTVVVQAPLEGLPLAPQASGRAEVVQTGDGRLLDVDVSRLGSLDGQYYEVWLIDRDVQKMVPVGILRGTKGQFVLPDGLDFGAYPVVDISVETPGDPRHSGRSVLRGTIPG